MEVANIWTIREYVWRGQATMMEYVTGRPIYKLFTGAERIEVSTMLFRWWYQEHDLTQAERDVG